MADTGDSLWLHKQEVYGKNNLLLNVQKYKNKLIIKAHYKFKKPACTLQQFTLLDIYYRGNYDVMWYLVTRENNG